MVMDLAAARAMLKNRPTSQNSGGGSDDIRWVSLPKEGELKIRFLPPKSDLGIPGKVISKHWNISVEGSNTTSFLCFKTHNLECPICNVLKKYESLIDVSDWEPSSRSYINVLVRNDSNYSADLPYILGSSDYTLYWLLEKVLDPDIGDITDLENGHDVTFKRRRPGGPFDRDITLKPSMALGSKEELASINENSYDFDKIWKVPDDEYLKKAQEIANQLAKTIETRLLSLSKSSSNPVTENSSGGTTQEAPTTTTTTQETSTVDSLKVSTNTHIPKGAPECFSKSHNSDDAKCQVCSYEFQCEDMSS